MQELKRNSVVPSILVAGFSLSLLVVVATTLTWQQRRWPVRDSALLLAKIQLQDGDPWRNLYYYSLTNGNVETAGSVVWSCANATNVLVTEQRKIGDGYQTRTSKMPLLEFLRMWALLGEAGIFQQRGQGSFERGGVIVIRCEDHIDGKCGTIKVQLDNSFQVRKWMNMCMDVKAKIQEGSNLWTQCESSIEEVDDATTKIRIWSGD